MLPPTSERSNFFCAQSIARTVHLLRARPTPSKGGDGATIHLSKLSLVCGGIDLVSFETMRAPEKFTIRVFATSAPSTTSMNSASNLRKRGSSLSSSQPSYLTRRGSGGAYYSGRSSSGLQSPPQADAATPHDHDDDTLFDASDLDNAMLLESWTFEPSTYTGDTRAILDPSQEVTLSRVVCSYCTMHPLPESPFRKITIRRGGVDLNETDSDKWQTKKWNMKNSSRDCLTVTRRFPLKHGPLPQPCQDGSQQLSAVGGGGRPLESTPSMEGGDMLNNTSFQYTKDRAFSRISPLCGPSAGRLTNASFSNSKRMSPPLHPMSATGGGSSQYVAPFELPSSTQPIAHSRTDSGNCGGGMMVGTGNSFHNNNTHFGSQINSFDGGLNQTMGGTTSALGSLNRHTRLSSGSSPYERCTTSPQSITLQISALAEKIQHTLRSNKPPATDVEEEFKNLQMQAPLHRLH